MMKNVKHTSLHQATTNNNNKIAASTSTTSTIRRFLLALIFFSFCFFIFSKSSNNNSNSTPISTVNESPPAAAKKKQEKLPSSKNKRRLANNNNLVSSPIYYTPAPTLASSVANPPPLSLRTTSHHENNTEIKNEFSSSASNLSSFILTLRSPKKEHEEQKQNANEQNFFHQQPSFQIDSLIYHDENDKKDDIKIINNNNNNDNIKKEKEFISCPFMSLNFDTEVVSSCPEEDFYTALWFAIRNERRPENRNRPFTIVDVGSNKGYSVAGIFENLNLSSTASSSSSSSSSSSPLLFSREALAFDIFDYAEKLDQPHLRWRSSLFGACCDGSQEPPYNSTSLSNHPWIAERKHNVHVSSIHAIMIDGTKSHIDYTNHFYSQQLEKYYYSTSPQNQKTNFTFHFVRAAVSGPRSQAVKNNNNNNHDNVDQFRPPTIKFCNFPLGAEHGRICKEDNTDGLPGLDTPVVTLDHLLPPLLAENNNNVIDLLLTDTEGHDFDVLEGAREKFLKPGKVGIYIFETHFGPNKRRLSDVVSELESYGYTCYIPVHGKNSRIIGRHVARISPSELCWENGYNNFLRGWKNVVCAHEVNFPELKHVFRELQYLRNTNIPQICDDGMVKKLFYDKHPEKDWSWALGTSTSGKIKKEVDEGRRQRGFRHG